MYGFNAQFETQRWRFGYLFSWMLWCPTGVSSVGCDWCSLHVIERTKEGRLEKVSSHNMPIVWVVSIIEYGRCLFHSTKPYQAQAGGTLCLIYFKIGKGTSDNYTSQDHYRTGMSKPFTCGSVCELMMIEIDETFEGVHLVTIHSTESFKFFSPNC